jgi:CrcB protein
LLNILFIALGGAIGSVGRYLVSRIFSDFEQPFLYLLGTASANVAGCFLFGFIAGFMESRSLINEQLRLFLLVGLMGGFTTFSTFGAETFLLLEKGNVLMAVANVLLQVSLGLLAVWAGLSLGDNF